jgi:hypothetical protein
MTQLVSVTPALLDVLYGAGWQEQRSIDVASFLADLRRRSFKSHPAAEEVYRSLIGIEVRSPTDRRRWVRFEPVVVSRILNPEDLDLLSRTFGKALYPLGLASSAFLLMTSDGEICFLDEDWLFFHRISSLESLLCGMCFSRPDIFSSPVKLSSDQKPIDHR